eukprot:Colp12_sorted_trinity150504_noHs@10620
MAVQGVYAPERDPWVISAEEFLKYTPSRRDGMSPEEELTLRREGIRYIRTICSSFKCNKKKFNDVTYTAGILFHRVYLYLSFKAQGVDYWFVALACCFLASKLEDAPQKINHVLGIGLGTKNPSDMPIEQKSKEYQEAVDKLVSTEMLVLKIVGFDFVQNPPKKIVVALVRKFFSADSVMLSIAQAMVTDSLETDLYIRWRPEEVAMAAVHTAATFFKRGHRCHADTRLVERRVHFKNPQLRMHS